MNINELNQAMEKYEKNLNKLFENTKEIYKKKMKKFVEEQGRKKCEKKYQPEQAEKHLQEQL